VPSDLLVVGAGPVGLATAIRARLRGLEVAVIEARRAPPLDKACGEGLMPEGVAALARMGVRLPERAGAPFSGIRYVDGAVVAEGCFTSGHGLGVRRTALSAALLERAREVGAEIHFATPMRTWSRSAEGIRAETPKGAFRARLLVGADGARSRVRAEAGLEGRPPRGPGRYGLRRHFGVTPGSGRVEVHWAEGAEAYVTPVSPDEVGVALLWRGGRARYEDLLGRFPALAARLAGARPRSSVRGAGPFHQRVTRRFAPGVALVGDAAGYLDAISGEGLTLGFRCAEALVDVVAAGQPLAAYERAYRELSATIWRMTRLLLAVAALPALRRRVIRTLAARPELFDRFLAITAGQAPLRSLGVGGALRLARGLVA
jgi:2-polyprenyl-6-methoxyphenol hydroxylase-like FAD-dependent oxidoreductase